MKWSFSQYNTFQQCQRQWFFKYKYANSNANDPLRNEAQRLSKLVNLKAWRGKIVDSVISDIIIPSFEQRDPISLEEAKKKAGQQFQRQLLLGQKRIESDDSQFSGYLEVEYGNNPQPEAFEDAWNDVSHALETLFKNPFVLGAFNDAFCLKAQKTLSFNDLGVSISGVPDVICFYKNRPPLIIDWKVHSNPIGNYWKQLGLYALALTKCKPHRDWPILPEGLKPSDIRLAEVQLLTDTIRIHNVTTDEIDELEETIAISSNEMSLVTGGHSPKQLCQKDFAPTNFPATCDYCSFKKLCWENL